MLHVVLLPLLAKKFLNVIPEVLISVDAVLEY